MSTSQITVSTPEILWHGGGNENGKPDPVYSVDFHPQESVLCTTGIDANVPPKGSVRLWKVDTKSEQKEFMLDLCDHQSAVNVARFSPNGKMLASASERQIVVYVVDKACAWSHIADISPLERIWLRPTLNEVFDLQWSPDSNCLIIGAIDNKAEIIRISTRDSLLLPGHSSYIQGVTWDPRNEMVITQSADRSCKAHKIKSKPNSMVKLAPRGHTVMRMHLGYQSPDATEAEKKRELTAADFGMDPKDAPSTISTAATIATTGSSVDAKCDIGEPAPTTAPVTHQSINLFADSFVPSFFRRLCYSPDGALIITPTGIHRPPSLATTTTTTAMGATSGTTKQNQSSSLSEDHSYCTHIFSRDNLSSPCVSLTGLEDPSIAVRCFARPFKMVQHEIIGVDSTSSTSSADADRASSTPADPVTNAATSPEVPVSTSTLTSTAAAPTSAAAPPKAPQGNSVIPGAYRFVFAVVTLNSVFVYDTQHAHPIAKFTGLHYAPINDVAWSQDGRILTACSSDGYLSFFRFAEGCLGDLLENDAVPVQIKQAQPCLFDYTPPPLPLPTKADAPTTTTSMTSASATNATAANGNADVVASANASGSISPAIEPSTVSTVNGSNGTATSTTSDIMTSDTDDGAFAVRAGTAEGVATSAPPSVTAIAAAAAAAATATVRVSISTSASASTVATADNESQKKRKRIQPLVIAELGTSIAASNSGCVVEKENLSIEAKKNIEQLEGEEKKEAAGTTKTEDCMRQQLSAEEEEDKTLATGTCVGAPPALTDSERKKKRISPVLIATYTGVSSACAVVPSSSTNDNDAAAGSTANTALSTTASQSNTQHTLGAQATSL